MVLRLQRRAGRGPALERGIAASKSRNFICTRSGVDSWGGFVFLNLTPAEAKPLAAQLGGIPDRLQRYPLRDLRIGATIRYEVAANWKIICENYNECYHCGGVHPELCAVVPSFREAGGADLDWNRGIPHREGAYTFTHSGTTARRAFPGLDADEQVRHKGELVYPNLFLSVACDHVAAFILQPRGAERTDITCHFLFETHEIDEARLRSVGCGGFLGSGQPPGLGGVRGRAEWNSRARPHPRLLRAHGRLESGHHGAM